MMKYRMSRTKSNADFWESERSRQEKMLSFVGCGAALYPKLYNSNAYFMLGNDLFLIDCGETAFRQHYMAGHFDGVRSVTVFITHMHTDHIGSLGTLIVYCYLKRGLITTVVFPESEKLRQVFDLTGIEPEHYRLFGNYAECEAPKFSVQPYRVKHHEKMINAYGLLFDLSGRKFYFSGDAAEIPQPVLNQLLSNEIDQLYQDTSVNDHGGAHYTLAQLEEAIPPEKRNKVFCMHYDGEFFDIIRSKGFQTIEDRVVEY